MLSIARPCFPVAVSVTLALGAVPAAAAQPDEAVAARFARLALECVHREYPNKIAHVLNDDGDARPPRELTPAFYGCYDWHSSVHGHWLLARLARLDPGAETTEASRAALARSLTVENLQDEAEYLEASGRNEFERPYGLAWLLQLAAELREWDDPDARRWRDALAPVETLAAERIREWLPKLTHPIRSGEHSQTAFAFGLILDWARTAVDDDMVALLKGRISDYYFADFDCPLRYEPSGEDFLSPCLAGGGSRPAREDPGRLRRLAAPVPARDSGRRQRGVARAGSGDRPDRRQTGAPRRPEPQPRLDAGGHCGRAPQGRRPPARASRRRGGAPGFGLASVTGATYEGGHWLGTFAVYLVTGRGLAPTAVR